MDAHTLHRYVTVATVAAIGWMMFGAPTNRRSVPRIAESAVTLDSSEFRDHPKSQALAAFYTQLAEVIERDAGAIVTTLGEFRAGHKRALRLAFAGTPWADSPKVGAEIDSILSAAIGGELDDRAIDNGLRSQLVSGLRMVASICGGPAGDKATR